MRRFLKFEIILLILIVTFLVMIAAKNSEAQQYFKFSGKVINNLQRGNITVQGDKGEVMNFAVGRRTIYIPSRLPGVGERVKVTYFLRRGHNVASQVEILPPPSPPKKK